VLRIRLRRTGAKKQPRYRVVVAESSAPRDGAYVEVLGWYNPQSDPAQVHVDTDKVAHWIGRGARPSGRVGFLLKRAGVSQPQEPQPTDASAAEELVDKAPARKRTSRRAAAEQPPAEAVATQAPESEPPARRRGRAKKDSSGATASETPEGEAPESQGSAGSAEG
jgi:small subunit ribosomal protein S16